MIAEDAEIAKGAIYFHFKSKSEIAAAVIESLSEMTAALLGEIAVLNESPLQKVKLASRRLAELVAFDSLASAGMRLSVEGNQFQYSIEPHGVWLETVGKWVEDAQTAQQLSKSLDSVEFAQLTISLLVGIQATSLASGDSELIPQRAEIAWECLVGETTVT